MSDIEQLQIFNPCSNSCGWPLWVQLVRLAETNRSLSDESLAAFLQEKNTVRRRLYTVVTHVDIPGNLACASLLYRLSDTAQWHSNLWQVAVKKLHQYLWRYVPEWRAERLIDSPSYLILWTEAAGSRLDLRTVVHGSTIPPPSQHLSGWSWCIFRHAFAASALWLSEVSACGNVAFFMLPHLPKPKQCLPNTDMLQSPHWPASLRLPRLASPCSPARAVAVLSLGLLLVLPSLSFVSLYLNTSHSATLAKSSRCGSPWLYSRQRRAPQGLTQKFVSLFKPPVSGLFWKHSTTLSCASAAWCQN